MPRSLRLAGLLAALIVLGVVAAVAQAAAPKHAAAAPQLPPGARADCDSRGGGATAAPAQRAARAKLHASLGRGALVSSDPATGRLRYVASMGKPLARGSAASATILGFVGRHQAAYGLDGGDLATLKRAQRVVSPDGVTHLTFDQRVGGIPVFGASLRGDLDRAGRLVDVAGSPAHDVAAPGAPQLSAAAALARAAATVGGRTHARRLSVKAGAERFTRFARNQAASLVIFPSASGTRLAWHVIVNGVDPYVYETVIDATDGRLLYRRNLTSFADNTATVFESWPGEPGPEGTQQVRNLSADPTWLDNSAANTRLFGNNSEAFADVNGNNADDGAGEDVARTGSGTTYRFPYTPVVPTNAGQGCPAAGCSWDPANVGSEATNRKEATVQAFYYVNKFHDHLLAAPIGFDEASGNFERVNSTGQGAGNDPVSTQSDDNVNGGARNNANMSTPPDGIAPTMQMFLFETAGPGGEFGAVNGDDEADVVYHEYTHGLSNRLVDTLAGQQGRSMGEAWSDFYAMDFLVSQGFLTDTSAPGDLLVGDFVSLGEPLIRTQPLDCGVGQINDLCFDGYEYGDFGNILSGPEVHADGEIWGETLWDIRRALGSNVALTLVTGAMRISPATPDFLDMRDAILLEDGAAYGFSHYNQLAAIFAARGMGADAASAGTNDVTPTANHVVATAGEQRTVSVDDSTGGDGDNVAEPGESFRITETARNRSPFTLTNATGSLVNPANGATSAGGAASFPGSWAPNTDKAGSAAFTAALSASMPCGQTGQATLRLATSQGTFTAPVSIASGSRATTGSETSSATVNVPDDNPAGVSSNISVSGTGNAKGVRITIPSLTHTFDSDLVITLSHAGRTAILANRVGANGDNFTNTTFRDDQDTPITDGTAPFTGSFKPATPLSVFDGTPRAGTWTLHIADVVSGDTGALHSWSDDTGAAQCSAPQAQGATATTGDATSIRATRATLHGAVNPRGTATSARFEFGRTTSYGDTTSTSSAGSGSADVDVDGTATGLRANTTYHYRALAVRGSTVVARGGDQTFKTKKRVLLPNKGTKRLNKKGKFTYSFKATARARGKLSFTTKKKFKKGKRKRHLVIASKTWHAKKSGKAAVTIKLKRKYVRLVRRQHKLTLTVKATVRGGSADRGKLTLKPHKKKGRRRH